MSAVLATPSVQRRAGDIYARFEAGPASAPSMSRATSLMNRRRL